MDVLVGSNGYIGSCLSTRLTDLSIPFIAIPSRHDFYNRIQLLHDQSIGTVYWCAAGIMPSKVSTDSHQGLPEFEFFCKLIKRVWPLANIVLLSTIGLVNYKPGFSSERVDSMRSVYFENRFRYEQKLLEIGNPSVILRISNVYGPNVSRQYGVIANWIRNIQKGQPIIVTDSLKNSRDYIYVADVIDAILVASRVRDGQILDLGCGSNVSLRQLLAIFRKVSDFRVEYLSDASPIGGRGRPKLNLAKTQSAIGWSPGIGLREGLGLTFKSEGLL